MDKVGSSCDAEVIIFAEDSIEMWGGDRRVGARENRGREGYGRRERKGREAGVLRGRAAGEKYETLIFLIQQCVRILSKTRTQNIRANYNAGLD